MLQGYVDSISLDNLTLKGWVQVGEGGEEPRLCWTADGEDCGTAVFGPERVDVRAARGIANRAFTLTLDAPLDKENAFLKNHQVAAAIDGVYSTIPMGTRAQLQLSAELTGELEAAKAEAGEVILEALQMKELALSTHLDGTRETVQARGTVTLENRCFMDQKDQILSSVWKEASTVSYVSGCAVEDQHLTPFQLNAGASIDSRQQHALDGLQDNLSLIAPDATAFMIQDALILGNGFIVYSPEGLVKESRYLANNFERRVEMSLRDDVVVLDESLVWIVAGNASSRSNYWHWFAQVLPAVLHCRDFARSVGKGKYGVITGPLKEWQIESLLVLGISREQIVQIDIFQSAKVKTCFYSSLLSGASVYSHNRYRMELRETFIQWAGVAGSFDEKLMISRSDTKKRPLLNEEALQAALAADGFRVVTGGSMSLREQVQAFHAASVIVAPHGAGSTNVMFGQSGGHYIELSQSSYPNAGPLSLCKTSGMLAWVDLFQDDGKGQSTQGWTAPIDVVRSTVAMAEAAVA